MISASPSCKANHVGRDSNSHFIGWATSFLIVYIPRDEHARDMAVPILYSHQTHGRGKKL